MKIVKMFDAIEIKKETGVDIFDVYDSDICNDSAIPWWVTSEDKNEKINSYLLAHGAIPGEIVWINVTW